MKNLSILYNENFDEFVSLVSFSYSLLVVPVLFTICSLSFICAAIFKKRRKKIIIFEYLYANTICDMLMNLLGSVFTICYFFVHSSNAFNGIYFACGVSLVRSFNMCSCFLSFLIMTQRFIFVHYNSYCLKRHTTLIITMTIVASFVFLTPFFFINIIKEIDDTILKNANKTNGLFIDFYKTVSPFLSIFRNQFLAILFLRFYQIVNFLIVLFALLFSLLTLRKVLQPRSELMRPKYAKHSLLTRRNAKFYGNQRKMIVLQKKSDCPGTNSMPVKHDKVTLMLILLTFAFIMMQLGIVVLHELYERRDAKLANNKLFLIGALALGLVYHAITLIFFYKFDKNVAFFLKRPFSFYRKFFKFENKFRFCVAQLC